VLEGKIDAEVSNFIRAFSEQQSAEIVELNVQVDHVHLLVKVPLKVSISSYVGTIKGLTGILVLNKFKQLKNKHYWGKHLWARGYCVDTVGVDAEMIRNTSNIRKRRSVDQNSNRFFN